MKSDMIKEVVYYLASKSMIKFVDDKTLYNISENVKQSLSLKKGDTVSVKIEEDNVVAITKVEQTKEESKPEAEKKDAKKVEEKEEEKIEDKSEEEAVIKTITIVAVRKDKTACKIDDGTWPKISDELVKKDPFTLGIVAKAVIDVKMYNGVIIDVVAIKEKPKEEKKFAKSTNQSNNSVNSSIEKQCALKSAVKVVKVLIEKELVTKDAIKACIKDLTKTCYEAIQQN